METSNYGTDVQDKPVMPKNWLVESILVTIFCCLVPGIVGIIYASQVQSKYNTGDYEGALQASKQAGLWTKIGFFIGLGIIVIYLIFIAIYGVAVFSFLNSASKY